MADLEIAQSVQNRDATSAGDEFGHASVSQNNFVQRSAVHVLHAHANLRAMPTVITAVEGDNPIVVALL